MGFNSRKKTVGVITEEIMATAIQRDSGHCLVADALRVALPGMVRWSVDLQTIRFSDPETGKRYIFLTPPLCQRILLDFDHGQLPPEGTEIGIRHPAQIVTTSAKAKAADRERKQARAKVHGNGQVTKIGGSVPPSAVLASGTASGRGRRRTFGLRLTEFDYKRSA